jgi:cation:H+ antiporter
MSPPFALALLAVSLAVTLVAAATFARRLDRMGARFGLPEVVIGLLTAAAADGPEVSSAVSAVAKGAHAAGVGVIVGSNAFNLASMLGLSALLAGTVRVRRQTLILEGGVGLAVTAIVIALLLGALPAGVAVLALACVLGPYLALVIAGAHVARYPHLPAAVKRLIALSIDDGDGHEGQAPQAHFATHRQILLMGLDVVLIVTGSFGMVEAALSLGQQWAIAPALVGALVLGPLTSLPNALTGLRLGLAGRGAALVAEAFNSNTINLVAGVAIPGLFVTLTTHSASARVDLALLVVMTALTLVLLGSARGMRRLGGSALAGAYLLFVVIEVLGA